MVQTAKNLPAMQETWIGKIPWRRERLPTPVLWPGESHGLYSPWGRKESDTTERLNEITSTETNGTEYGPKRDSYIYTVNYF